MDRSGHWQGTSTPDQELAALRTTVEKLRAELDRERARRQQLLGELRKIKEETGTLPTWMTENALEELIRDYAV